MKFPRAIVAAVAVLSLAFSAHAEGQTFPRSKTTTRIGGDAQPKVAEAAVVPNTYIVQLKNEDGVLGVSKRSFDSHNKFHRLSKKAAISYDTRETYADPALFVGLSLTLNNDADVQALKDLENVVGLWPVRSILRPSAAIPLGDMIHTGYTFSGRLSSGILQ
jgi:hypothetical protein